MITSSDVFEVAKHLWGTVRGLLVTRNVVGNTPGDVHLGRATETENARLYASAKVTEGSPLWTATASYLQPFTLEMRLWSDTAAESTGEIGRLMDSVFNVRTRTTYSLNNSQQLAVLHSLRQPGSLEQDESRKEAKDVLVLAQRYEMLIQGEQ